MISRNIADIATREDVRQLENEATRQRNEIKAEIMAVRESADAQMQEPRGYIVQHLEQHGPARHRAPLFGGDAATVRREP